MKIVEQLAKGKYRTELTFLKTLIKAIIKNENFDISAGRVWELDVNNFSYDLKYQIGQSAKLPKHYKVHINDYPVLNKLVDSRTAIDTESNMFLQSKGINIFSVTGIGEIIKINNSQYFKYLFGFTSNTSNRANQPFSETLSIIGSVATITLRNISSNEKQKRINKELLLANEIQNDLFPKPELDFSDFQIYGICMPAGSIGGDYFDYVKSFNEEDNRVGILVCDAASKGLPASIQALYLSGAIRMANFFRPRISTLLYRLNELIFQAFPYDRFVTLFYIELTSSSKRLALYANAGHCPAIHFRKNKQENVDFLKPTAGFLGLTGKQIFNVESVTIDKGDILVIYTDGITESQDANGNQYSEEKLINLINANQNLSAKDLAICIIDDVQLFSASGTYSDDKTVVVIKRNM